MTSPSEESDGGPTARREQGRALNRIAAINRALQDLPPGDSRREGLTAEKEACRRRAGDMTRVWARRMRDSRGDRVRTAYDEEQE